MNEITILSDASTLSTEQQEQLLNLHYAFLTYQRQLLDIKADVPTITLNKLFLGNRIVVATREGVVVGYCIYRIISGVLKVRSLFVTEAHRRTGVMTKMMSAIDGREVYQKSQLSIFKKCTGAKAFFTRLGYIAKPSDDWFMLFFDRKSQQGSPSLPVAVPA